MTGIFMCIRQAVGKNINEFKNTVAANPDGFLNCGLTQVMKYVEEHKNKCHKLPCFKCPGSLSNLPVHFFL